LSENRELALVLKLVADQFQSELKKSQGALSGFNSFIKDWKVQLGAVTGVLVALAKSTANFGEEALKGAQKAGQTVETFTALSYAAKLADIDQQQLIVGLKSLSQNMVEAARQTGDGEAVFRRLGVSALDASGKLRPTEQVLLDLADVFAKSADGAGKTEAAVKLFGKAGLELVPFLNQGKAGIAGLMEEAKRLGVVLSTEDAQAASAFNDEIKRLESATRGLTLQLGQGLLPTMTSGLELFSKMIAKVRELNSETSNVGQNLKNWSDAFGQSRMGQGMMDTFTALGLGHRKGEGTLPREQFWMDTLKSIGGLGGQLPPGGGVLASSGGEDKPPISMGPDLKKLQDDYRLYITGLTSAGQAYLDKLKKDYHDYITGLTSMGQQYLDRLKGTGDEAVKLFQEHQQQISKERDVLIENENAWISYGDTLGASTEFMLQHRLDLVRLELGKELNLNQEQAGRLLLAWQNHDDELAQSVIGRSSKTEAELETIQLRTLQKSKTVINELSGDFFDGWAAGMRNYVRDTQSGFGMAADMARRSIQSIEQASGRFFFDAMEGRITRLKDVMASFLDFTKQIVSQLAGQAITRQIAGAIAGGFPNLFGSSGVNTNFSGDLFKPLGAASGGLVQRFARGGPVLGNGNLDTVPALLTPGEFVLSRRDVKDIKSGLGGGGIIINTYNTSSAQVEHQVSQGANGVTVITQTIKNVVAGMVQSGGLDRQLGVRYGVTPTPGRR